jgi:hypothetical protein
MKVSSETRSRGVGFFGLLGLLFIGLKLTHYIDWSWWLVLLPLYGPVAVAVAVVFIMLFLGGLLLLIAKVMEEVAHRAQAKRLAAKE